MVAAVRRIHKRKNVRMVTCDQVSVVMKGILQEHIEENGYESLLANRREPLDGQHVRDFLSTPAGTKLGRTTLDWHSPLGISLGALFSTAVSTGFRKAEAATPNGRSLDQRRLRRSNLHWLIDGKTVASPSSALLASMVSGRDGAILIPPPSKADQTGQIWGVYPIHLVYDPTDLANAATWLRKIELSFPVLAANRATTALFFVDSHLTAMRHSTVDTYLKHFLQIHLGAVAGNYSFHSFRIGFACALLAAGCDVYTIQALARWRSPESIRIYARMNPAVYSSWIVRSLKQRATSTSTSNLLVMDSHDAIACLQFENNAGGDNNIENVSLGAE